MGGGSVSAGGSCAFKRLGRELAGGVKGRRVSAAGEVREPGLLRRQVGVDGKATVGDQVDDGVAVAARGFADDA